MQILHLHSESVFLKIIKGLLEKKGPLQMKALVISSVPITTCACISFPHLVCSTIRSDLDYSVKILCILSASSVYNTRSSLCCNVVYWWYAHCPSMVPLHKHTRVCVCGLLMREGKRSSVCGTHYTSTRTLRKQAMIFHAKSNILQPWCF